MSLLRLELICKNYGGVKALKLVNLVIEKGEIHSVIGENGAGKSTMMKIISGVTKPSKGNLYYKDIQKSFQNVSDAEKEGIFIIHQEPMFFPDLTVLENIFIGQELKNNLGFLNWKKMRKEANKALINMELDSSLLDIPMGELPIGTQQMVLIVKGVYRKSSLLILDEPTSILSFEESLRLFKIIKNLAKQGVGILYISHRIPEILELSDKISVLRDGLLIQTLLKEETTPDQLLELMSGQSINRKIEWDNTYSDEVILKVDSLSSPCVFNNISFELKKGQILGFYGLVGAGRTEVAQAIIGERSYTGSIQFKNKEFCAKNAKHAYAQKIVYLPEDRITQGTFSSREIKVNMMAGLLDKLVSKNHILNPSKESILVTQSVDIYNIKINSIEDPISSLSGGNQQKVLFTRCLLHKPEILILDEPTRGIDVKTKVELYKLIISLAKQGVSIILISSELSEILTLTNSICVMHEGEYVDCFTDKNCTEKNILKAALGS